MRNEKENQTNQNQEEIIFSYSRAQALEDGVLADISSLAKEAGFKYPVAVTQGVYSILDDARVVGQSFEGRCWDMLTIFRYAIKKQNSSPDTVYFAPLFLSQEADEPKPVQMWAKCGAGDDYNPVITIMLEGED